MKKFALIAALAAALPLASYAAAPAPAAQPNSNKDERRAEREEQMERRMRTLRAVGLAETLNLNEAQALQLDAAMRPFDDRRRPIQEAIRADGELLKRASDGDPAAQKDVDAALGRIFENRSKVEAINREMIESISHGMAPQQKAKLALFLAHFKREMGKAMHAGMHGHEE